MLSYISQLLHTFRHLQHLNLECNERGEVMFEMDRDQPPLLPHLEYLKLSKMKKMSHVWKCNWNKFLIPQQKQPPFKFPFQNLGGITSQYCDKIKYLFSPLIAEFLSKLEYVTIECCESIEEVISSRDDEKAIVTSSERNNTLFPHLRPEAHPSLPAMSKAY